MREPNVSTLRARLINAHWQLFVRMKPVPNTRWRRVQNHAERVACEYLEKIGDIERYPPSTGETRPLWFRRNEDTQQAVSIRPIREEEEAAGFFLCTICERPLTLKTTGFVMVRRREGDEFSERLCDECRNNEIELVGQ